MAGHQRIVNATRDTAHSMRAWSRWLTASDRPLPDFLIIGAQRAGTTSLYENLRRHPQVLSPIGKEVQFFTIWHALGERWYRSHFPRLEPGQQTFEASPYYFFHPDVPARVSAMLPRAKCVVLLRDPVARAYSHYLHSQNLGVEDLPFEKAIDAEPVRMAAALDRGLDTRAGRRLHSNYSYVSRGIYTPQLERWKAHLPDARLKIVRSEDLYQRPMQVYADLLDYLGLPAFTPEEFTRSNVLNDHKGPKLAAATEARLRERFAEDSERVRSMLGWDDAWQ